jgi:hypothetical protein
MAENTNRNVFGLHGILGNLILVVLLLGILFYLVSSALTVQQESAVRPYNPAPIRDINNLKMISVDNKQFAFQPKKDK